MEGFNKWYVLLGALILYVFIWAAVADEVQPWDTTTWGEAHATFYGGQDASRTMGGACGYGNLYSTGYGTANTELCIIQRWTYMRSMLYSGLQIGGKHMVLFGGKSIIVTATNSCPPGSEGGWCDPPRLHFDLSYPMFQALAQPVGGVIPVRVPCAGQGGVRFNLLGNQWFNYVLIYNVKGGDNVASILIKGTKTNWVEMYHNWGQFWSANENLVGQALSFKVILGDGSSLVFQDVTPDHWQFGQTYEADNNQNFG